MKRLGILVLLCASAFGQMSSTGSITASGSTCGTTNACISLALFNSPTLSTSTATIALSGPFSGTIQFEGTTDNVNWTALLGSPIGGGSAISSANTTGTWSFGVSAFNGIRARASAFTSGTATVLVQASTAGGIPTGAAGGALSGNFPNPTLSTTGYLMATWTGAAIPPISNGAGNAQCNADGSLIVTAGNSNDGSLFWCQFEKKVLPNVDGITHHIIWGTGNNSCANGCGSNSPGVDIGFDLTQHLSVPVSWPPTSAQYTFTTLDTRILAYIFNLGPVCGVNLGRAHVCTQAIILGASASNNPPEYVFSQAGANLIVGATPWTTATTYYGAQQVSFGGTFYHLNQAAPFFCTSSGTTGPPGDACTWVSDGVTNAAPQDVLACTGIGPSLKNNPGLNNINDGTDTALGLRAGFPVMQETPITQAFLYALKNLQAFVITKPYASTVAYIRPGHFIGEWFPKCLTQSEASPPLSATATELQWENMYQSYFGGLTQTMKANRAAVAPTGPALDFSFAGLTLAYDNSFAASAEAAGAGIGMQGTQILDIANFSYGEPTSNNWTALLQQYSADSKVPFYHLQQNGQSVESNASPGGSIAVLLPFMMQQRYGKPTYIEAFESDLMCAFWPEPNGYSQASDALCPFGGYAPYATAFASMSSGFNGQTPETNSVSIYSTRPTAAEGSIQLLQTPALNVCQANPNGTLGATTYTYKVQAIDQLGLPVVPAINCTTTQGNASLSVSNFNTITFNPVSVGAQCYKVYRTAGGTGQGYLPSSTGATTCSLTAGTGAPPLYTDNGSVTPDANDTAPVACSGSTCNASDSIGLGVVPASIVTQYPIAAAGVTDFFIVKLAGANGTNNVANVLVSDTDAFGIAQATPIFNGNGNAATTGNAQICTSGESTCLLNIDNSTNFGDYVQISGTAAGKGHGIGASYPSSGGIVVGRVIDGGTTGVHIVKPLFSQPGNSTTTAHTLSVPLACPAASASGTTYTCSTTPSFTPASGDVILFIADVASTGAVTLAVNGQGGPPALQKVGGSGVALVANDLRANGAYLVEYNGATWQTESPSGIDPLNSTNQSSGNLNIARISTALSSPTAIGNTTPSTGKFSTLGTTGLINLYNNLTPTGNGVGSIQASTGAVTIGSGASIAATSLCSTTQCPAGRYRVDVYIDITTACTTTGSYIPWLGYTDDAGAKAGSSTTTYFSGGGGLGVTPATASTGLTLVPIATTDSLTASYFLQTTGAATGGLGSINYGTTATACGTGGPMIGKMYLDVTRLE